MSNSVMSFAMLYGIVVNLLIKAVKLRVLPLSEFSYIFLLQIKVYVVVLLEAVWFDSWLISLKLRVEKDEWEKYFWNQRC